MKKLIIAALAIAAMAACTKSNVQLEQPGEIAFQPVAQKATKAAVTGTWYPTDSKYNFNVWAWWAEDGKNDVTDFKTVYINDQTFVARDNEKWGGEGKAYYWPTTGSLYFAGYSPASIQKKDGNGNNVVKYDKDNKKFSNSKYKELLIPL